MKKMILYLSLALASLVGAALLLHILLRVENINTQLEQILDTSPYMQVDFLSKPDVVKNELCKKDCFKEVSFKTEDNLTINGLLRINPDAHATVIALSGWWGNKEGIAPLVPMFPEDQYNVLLYDARGVGASEGQSKWRTIPSFGIDEPKDVIASIEFIHRMTDGKPIIVWGTSAGAFYSAHALVKLTEQNLIDTYNIKGLIFDSGCACPAEVMLQTSRGYTEERTHPIIAKSAQFLFKCVYDVWLKSSLQQREPQTNLYDKIDKIAVPIFYIHSKDDKRAYLNAVQKLCEKTKNKQLWILPGSTHANHQLIFKYDYAKRLREFCQTVAPEPSLVWQAWNFVKQKTSHFFEKTQKITAGAKRFSTPEGN